MSRHRREIPRVIVPGRTTLITRSGETAPTLLPGPTPTELFDASGGRIE